MIGTVSASNTTNTLSSDLTDNHITHQDTNQNDDKTMNTYISPPNNQLENTIPLNDKNSRNKITQDSPLKTETSNVYVNKSSESSMEKGTKLNPYKTINETLINGLKNNTTINIANGRYELDTINLNNNISIIGQNRDETILYTNSKNGLFNINANSNLKLINLTIRDYESTISSAITNNGHLTVENMFFQNASHENAKGGFIYSTNNLTVINCTFDSATAAYGAHIYTNTGQTIIINSNFTNSETSLVGGSIYSLKSETEIYNSIFMYNKGTSGAAVYNAFGNLTVNNSYFSENYAKELYGGAIYTSGRAIVNNSEFIENQAMKDGGAITNTNYFYSINCNYISNWANNNGGAIENIPLNDNEIGNITILNNTFSGNGVSNYGGVIINYNDHATLPISGTITIIDTKFIENMAYQGGVIYNELILNIINSTLTDNTAEEGNIIYMTKASTAKLINTEFKDDDIYCKGDNFKIELINSNTIIIHENNPSNNNTNEHTTQTNSEDKTEKKDEKTTNTQNTNPQTNISPKKSKKTTKQIIKIIANKKTFKVKIKTKKYSITLKSSNKTIKKIKVILKIKGKTYIATTNNKGKATFKITKLNKRGTYKAIIIFKGDKKYNKSTKAVKIIVQK